MNIWTEIWNEHRYTALGLVLWAITVLTIANMARPKKPRYKQLEIKFVTFAEAEEIIERTANQPEPEQWRIVKDSAARSGMVMIERRERIYK